MSELLKPGKSRVLPERFRPQPQTSMACLLGVCIFASLSLLNVLLLTQSQNIDYVGIDLALFSWINSSLHKVNDSEMEEQVTSDIVLRHFNYCNSKGKQRVQLSIP